MIEICEAIMTLIATELGITIIRKNEDVAIPEEDYGVYFLSSVVGGVSNNKRTVENADPTKFTYRYFKANTLTLSLIFHSATSIAAIHTLAQDAINYLQISINDIIRPDGYQVELFEPKVTDTTTYIDSIYDYQVGFDFKVTTRSTLDKIIDSVNLDTTFEGIETDIT